MDKIRHKRERVLDNIDDLFTQSIRKDLRVHFHNPVLYDILVDCNLFATVRASVYI